MLSASKSPPLIPVLGPQRHWEKESLIRSNRNPENGYRTFTSGELKKIIVLSSLRKTVYFIENMRQLLTALETSDFAAIERSFKMALQQLNEQLKNQMNGISEMMKYIELQSTLSVEAPKL
ncbi:hypothetical protein J2TS6_40390 [Paenibacillus albilobatus]|uniref:HTH merR-type domain-containing protein n=2 Tax=Paenibacillus TaxID=44249 RepID=A0A919XMJ4_9BACL|nr:hypothetical protein J2TS6_40390 [Paenibacillus albilobatus]